MIRTPPCIVGHASSVRSVALSDASFGGSQHVVRIYPCRRVKDLTSGQSVSQLRTPRRRAGSSRNFASSWRKPRLATTGWHEIKFDGSRMAFLAMSSCSLAPGWIGQQNTRRPRLGAKCPALERYFLSLLSPSSPARILFAHQIVAGLVDKLAPNFCTRHAATVPTECPRGSHVQSSFCSTLPTITVDYCKTCR